MSIAVFLPPQLLSHVRHVFAREPEFFAAQSWNELEGIIRREPVNVVIIDPAADGAVDVDSPAGILQRYPSLPVVGYVMLTATAFGAIAQLSRRGLSHVVLHRFGDSKERLQQMVARVRANPLSRRVMAELTPVLKQVPLSLSRAVTDMFDRPHRYNSVLELSTSADLSTVSVYRYLDTVGLRFAKEPAHSGPPHARSHLSQRSWVFGWGSSNEARIQSSENLHLSHPRGVRNDAIAAAFTPDP
jgi:hypothetical protein